MSDEEKNRAVVVDHQHQQYGTFQGVANYPPPLPPQHQHRHHQHQPAIGFPQPVPPPGLHEPSAPPPQYYPQGYQTVPGICKNKIRFFLVTHQSKRRILVFGFLLGKRINMFLCNRKTFWILGMSEFCNRKNSGFGFFYEWRIVNFNRGGKEPSFCYYRFLAEIFCCKFLNSFKNTGSSFYFSK